MNICETFTRKFNQPNIPDMWIDKPHQPTSEHRYIATTIVPVRGMRDQIRMAECKHCGSIVEVET